jgi:iron complex transport system ATP-binding protein
MADNGPLETPINSPLLELRGVTIWREQHPALHEISLVIRQGEHTAILGPNGSGKSTLIKTITRECYPRYAPPACALRILGRETWHVDELRSMLGIVTNDLVQTCTQPYPAREIVLSGFFSSVGIWPWHEVTPGMEEKADELLEFVGIRHLADRLMTEMSSGEVRRAVIARALVHQPKALLLDEPTNSLDIRGIRDLRETMSRMAQSGLTLILVTHHLPDIVPEIGRVICLKNGRIVDDGPATEILTSETLTSLFEIPVAVHRLNQTYHLA